AVNGEIQQGGSVGSISIPTDILDAKATPEIKLKANLNSMEAAITEGFDPNKKDTFNFSAPLQVFDSLGNQHDINVFFVKTDNNKWIA
ncbi:flagellar basal body FlgE domain-containing protein, partial [Xenorhabdus bovienii]|uniref:flagellar basal body FlgE domain-containing protein n=1 Tax=Xenorhabdus bovienii TaxID=40576 RepID=UPI0023B25BE1